MYEFGELKKVQLREMWPNEAANFTPWLASNIESLGKALGFELELTEEEAKQVWTPGSFNSNIDYPCVSC